MWGQWFLVPSGIRKGEESLGRKGLGQRAES